MAYWLATQADVLRHDWIKRFDPRFWALNFPRPMMAAVTTTAADALQVDLAFLKRNDLAGLIWESEDRFDHPLLSYRTSRDYRGIRWRFHWQADAGILPLDVVNGPVLTIEGRDASGSVRAWYVRLWNYAVGTPTDAVITLDFDGLDGGFLLPDEADPVWPGDIDRIFFSLVPLGYDAVDAPLAMPVAARVSLSDISCTGAGSTIAIGDTFVPTHGVRIATAYDDSYNLTPARMLRGIIQTGYAKLINHYVGISHYPALLWNAAEARFIADPSTPINAPCAVWHADFAARAASCGFDLIQSLSFELFDAYAPQDWKQRDATGNPALTGYLPPSTLLSPANSAAMTYLADVAKAVVAVATAAGQQAHFQIGEPWWWVGTDQRPCIYDAATSAAYMAETGLAIPGPVTDIRTATSAENSAYLDWLGVLLGRATLALRDAVSAVFPDAVTYLLFYAPQVLRPDAPDLARANLPAAWAYPAWDVLQLEDYDFVTGDDFGGQAAARKVVSSTLGYPVAKQHYFSGFVLRPEDRDQWASIDAAADAARQRGVAQTFVWAWPQVARDGFVIFDIDGDETMPAFHDVLFPLELGFGAAGGPQFSTQIAVTASGFEQRNSNWADARLNYDAGVGIRSETDLAALIGFFRARRGQAHGFRFRDPLDSSSRDDSQAPTPFDQLLGNGDGLRTNFALIKSYGEIDSQIRRVTRPVAGSIRVSVAGIEQLTGWVIGERGAIDFDIAPAAGTTVQAGYIFDVPVRFADDRIDVSLAGFRTGELPSVPIVEIRED